MGEKDDLNLDQSNDLETLENTATVIEPSKNNEAAAKRSSSPTVKEDASISVSKGHGFVRRLIGSLNIYMLIFILILILFGVGTTLFYLKARNESPSGNTPASQILSQSALDNLANSDVTVGEPQHTLNVQSNAEFTGNVLMRANLQIAGSLQVGSNLAINGIRVTGNSTFDDVQVTNLLAVTGNGSFQGQLNVQNGLNVKGGGTFLGALSAPSLAVGTLQLNNDLTLSHHIAAGGSTPTRNNGTALGSGGTVSISGSDTAGTVTINSGSSPNPGCFVTINFTQHFNNTPHIVVTPVGSSAAGLGYYINRSTSSFSICSTNPAPGNTTFGFDYIAFD